MKKVDKYVRESLPAFKIDRDDLKYIWTYLNENIPEDGSLEVMIGDYLIDSVNDLDELDGTFDNFSIRLMPDPRKGTYEPIIRIIKISKHRAEIAWIDKDVISEGISAHLKNYIRNHSLTWYPSIFVLIIFLIFLIALCIAIYLGIQNYHSNFSIKTNIENISYLILPLIAGTMLVMSLVNQIYIYLFTGILDLTSDRHSLLKTHRSELKIAIISAFLGSILTILFGFIFKHL